MKNLNIALKLMFCVLLLISCTAERHSVFHVVITDRAEVDSSLDNDLSIIGMAGDGTDYYVAVAGALWKRPVSGNTSEEAVDWEPVDMPTDAWFCTAFIGHGTNLYGGFMLTDNSFAFYQGIFNEYPGWVKLTDPEVLDKQVTRLFSLNSGTTLFASVKEGAVYSLYYSSNGTDFLATGISGSDSPVTSMILAGDYWAVTKANIYRGTAANMADLTIALDPALETGEGYQAVYYSLSKDEYFLSLNNGYVFASSDSGATWPNKCAQMKSRNDKNIVFTQIAEIDRNIIVGTVNNGFYQAKDGDITALSAHEDELVSDINISSVLGFFVDTTQPAGKVVFFMTGGYGLYRNTYNDESQAWGALCHE